MSKLLFCDSFDHYTNAWNGGQMGRKWSGGSSLSILPRGRNGNGAVQDGLGSYSASHTFAQGTQSTTTVGFAWKPGSSNQSFPLTVGNAQSGWRLTFPNTGDGRIYAQLYAGAQSYFTSNPSGAATTWVQQGGIWYYVEIQVNVAAGTDSDGTNVTTTYTAKVNGVQVLSASILGSFHATIPGAWVSIAYFAMGGNGDDSVIDDLYVTDGEFLGDVTVSVLRPVADGASQQWTPLSGTDHFAMVSDVSSDDDASYVLDAGSPLNDVDFYSLTQIAGTPEIKGVQALWCVKNDITGPSTLQGEYRNGSGTVHDVAATYPSSASSYNYYIDALRNSPFSGSEFTVAELNALQLGLKRTA